MSRAPRVDQGEVPALSGLWLAAIAFLATRAAMLVLKPFAADTHLYFERASALASGARAYLDLELEYPPLAVLSFLVPLWIPGARDSFAIYRAAFAGEMLLCDALAFTLVASVCRRERRGVVPVFVYVLFGAVMQPLMFDRFDIAVGAAMLAAVVLVRRGGRARVAGWLALAAGFLFKITPLVLAPILLLQPGREVSWRRRIGEALAGFALPVLLVVAWRAESLLEPLAYHRARGIQLESVWASVALAARWLGATVSVQHEFGAEHLHGPVVDLLLPWVRPAMALALVVATLRARREDLLQGATCVLLALIATANVLSPQFLLWLVPFVPLARRDLWLPFLLVVFLTSVLFRLEAWRLTSLMNGGIVLLDARNLVLVGTAWIALRPRESDTIVPGTVRSHS
jgi:hypothetical protein